MRTARDTARRGWRAAAFGVLSVVLAGSVLLTAQPAAAQSTAGISTQRVSGFSVYELAANVAGGNCDTKIGSHSVALASGENWPDALAGAALDRPLLLTKQAFLPAVTRAYLEPCSEHSSAKVIILGGPAAVSEDVAATLRSMGYRVDRYAGDDRYETARRVASQFAPDSISTVYLASGVNFADAVAAAPSVTNDTPLILTTPDELHSQARRFLTDEDRDVKSVTILGGNAAISAEVDEEIHDLGIETTRVAGADRYETAAMIARRAFNTTGCHPVTDVAVASGTVPFGGLAAGAVRDPCQPLLLAPDPNSPVPETLAEFGQDWLLSIGRSTAATVTAIGSAAVISTATLRAVATGSAPGSTGSTGSGATGGGPDWEDIAQSVVQVRCVSVAGGTLKSGSGFVVGDGRHIVTNHHVVFGDDGRECRRIRVYLGGTFEEVPTHFVPVAIVRAAEARDLALLTMDPDIEPLPTVTIADESLRAGETITALGYPGIGGDTMTLTTGRYSGTTELDGVTWIKTDTPIAPGNSGGPAFNDRRELIGVTTLLRLAITGGGGTTVGTLGLLAPADDVLALLAGEIGEATGATGSTDDTAGTGTAHTSAAGEGFWIRGNAGNTDEPYVALFASADQHTLPPPYEDVTPILAVFCNDDVQIEFWDPATAGYGGPLIAGQTGGARSDLDGRVPVAYSANGGQSVDEALWWPTETNHGIIAGDQGPEFVSDLTVGSGELSFGFTNFDGQIEVMTFPSIDGFVPAYQGLQQRCSSFS